jgi:hypothetical protein
MFTSWAVVVAGVLRLLETTALFPFSPVVAVPVDGLKNA